MSSFSVFAGSVFVTKKGKIMKNEDGVARCKDCGVRQNESNSYRKARSSSGYQIRCKKCQIEYQKKLRENKKAARGSSLVEIKVSGRDGAIRLQYSPRRQIVDVYGPAHEEGRKAGAFWANAFDCQYTYKEGKRTFHLRVLHVARDIWDEVTVDLETAQKVEEEAAELRDYESGL